MQNAKLLVLKTVNRTAGYFPVARYYISPTPGAVIFHDGVFFSRLIKSYEMKITEVVCG